jgi:uncharacterized membrane protein
MGKSGWRPTRTGVSVLSFSEKLLFEKVSNPNSRIKGMNIETVKNLGGIGAILIVIGSLATFGYGYLGILSLIGLIMVLVALKGMADYYSAAGIFNNALYGFIAGIVGIVIAGVTLFLGVLYFVTASTITLTELMDPTWWTTQTMDPMAFFNLLMPLLTAIIAAFVILFVFLIVTAWLFRRSFNMAAAKSGVHMFETAGLVLLIGAVLTIILIGFVIAWIAFILLAVAFFGLKPAAPQAPQQAPTQA